MPKIEREEMAFAQIQIPGLGLKPLISRVKQIWQIPSLGLKPLTSHVKEIWQREGIVKEHQA
jgi:hypothetical protein